MLVDDQHAIDQVLDGDSAAYAVLVERYQRRLLGLLWHVAGDQGLAEDIAQEAFTRAYQKLSSFSGESQFYTWLARIAMNLLISNRRRRRIETDGPGETIETVLDRVGESNPPDRQLELNEMQRCVRSAIAMLDTERRAVLILRDFDGMDYEAIAEALQIPVGTVRSRLHRARLELKSILQTKAIELGLSGT